MYGIGQRLHFGHGVDVGGTFAVDDITEQAFFWRGVHAGHTDGGVVGLRRMGGVVGHAIGIAQNGVVAVHDGLHFGSGIGLGAGDVCVVQGAVDRGQVLSGHTGHAQGFVLGCAGAGGAGGVGLRRGFDGGQSVDGVAHHRLHAAQGVELRGVRGSGQGRLQGAEVGRGHAADAQRFELRLCGVTGHHGLHSVGQGLHLGHGVHIGQRFGVDHIAEQGDFLGAVHAIDADGSVVGLRRVGGVVGHAIGVAEDGVVAVHDGLHFGCGVGLCAGDVCVVQGAVDGGQVLGGHTRHAERVVLRGGRAGGAGGVGLRRGFDGGQGVEGLGHHGLHTAEGVEFDSVNSSSQCGLHAAEVGGGHANDAQCHELPLGGVAVHHGLHGVGQGLHFGHAVHIGAAFGVDHIAEQGDFLGGVQTVHADGGVVGLGRVGLSRVVGVADDGVEAVHDGLHFGRSVGLGAGDVCVVQGAVDGGQIGRADAGHAHGEVLRIARGRGGGGVALRGGFDGGQGVDGVAHHSLHTGLRVEVRGVVGLGGGRERGLHGAQVGGCHAADAQGFELGLCGVARHHGLHGVGQRLQFGEGVHIGGGFAVEHFTQEAEFLRGVYTVHTDGGVVGGRRVGCVARHAVGGAQDDVVRINDGLYFGGRAGLRAADVCVVQGAVHGAQVLRRHAADAQGFVLSHGGVGGGGVVVLCGRLDGRQRALVSGDCRVDHALQLAERVSARATVGLRRDGLEHGAQVVSGGAGQAQQRQIDLGQSGRRCATRSQGLNGVGNARQFVDLGDGVHTGRGFGAHDVVEQTEVFCIAGSGTNAGPDLRVLRSAGVAGGVGIGHVAVGFGQHGFVGVDDGLHFSGGVGFGAVDDQAGQGVVDGVDVVGIDTSDTGSGVVGVRGGRGRLREGVGQPACLGLGKTTQGAQRVVVAGDGRIDQTLKFGLAGDGRAVGVACRDGGLHSSQVVGGNGVCSTRAAGEAVELGSVGAGLACGTGVGDGGGHGVGQGLQLVHGVHIGRDFGANDGTKQGFFGR